MRAEGLPLIGLHAMQQYYIEPQKGRRKADWNTSKNTQIKWLCSHLSRMLRSLKTGQILNPDKIFKNENTLKTFYPY